MTKRIKLRYAEGYGLHMSSAEQLCNVVYNLQDVVEQPSGVDIYLKYNPETGYLETDKTIQTTRSFLVGEQVELSAAGVGLASRNVSTGNVAYTASTVVPTQATTFNREAEVPRVTATTLGSVLTVEPRGEPASTGAVDFVLETTLAQSLSIFEITVIVEESLEVGDKLFYTIRDRAVPSAPSDFIIIYEQDLVIDSPLNPGDILAWNFTANSNILEGTDLLVEMVVNEEGHPLKVRPSASEPTQIYASLMAREYELKPLAYLEEVEAKEDSPELIDINVDDDQSVTLDASYANKIINLTQTSTIAKPMQFFVDPRNTFELGDTIKFLRNESYVNHYFVIYYSQSNGVQGVAYPNQNAEMTATTNGWDVTTDSPYTKTAIVPREDVGQPYVVESPDSLAVRGIILADHPAVSYVSHNGIDTLNIDLHSLEERDVHVFINEPSVEIQYTQKFIGDVYLLGGHVFDHLISVEIDGILKDYQAVGLYKIGADNQWSTRSKRMAFKDTTSVSYIVFDDTVNAWVLGDLGDPSTNYRSSNEKTVLNNDGILPKSFGSVNIDVNFDNIESKHFSKCDPVIEYDTENKLINVSFLGKPQVGFIVL